MMFHKENLTVDEVIAKNEAKLKQLELENERLNQQMREVYNTLQITPEQLRSYANNPDNFSKDEWQSLQEIHAQHESSLQQRLACIRDPKKIQRSYADRNVRQDWIFVK